MTREELVNLIKTAITQLANDETAPRRQILRELKDIRSHLGSAIDELDDATMGNKTMPERDEL